MVIVQDSKLSPQQEQRINPPQKMADKGSKVQ